jgi:5-methylcytosine-specific restriction endonuclease McrA
MCTECEIEKSLSEFSRQRKGHSSQCKSCKNIYAAAYRAANKKKIACDAAKHYLIHKNTMNRKNKNYRIINRDILKEKSQIYSDMNKDKKEKYRNSYAIYETFAHQINFAEQVFESESGQLLVFCTYCGKVFMPSVKAVCSRISALNGKSRGECRLYCSEACKGACPSFNQEKHWKGTKPATSREVSAQFRQIVLKRDNWTCQRCGAGSEAELHVHHIDGATQQPGMSNDIENGVTLCKECHEHVHSQDGCKYHELRCPKE